MVDHKFHFRHLHYRQVRRSCALEDAANIGTDLKIRVDNVRSVAHQAPGLGDFTCGRCHGDSMTCCQVGKLHSPAGEKYVGGDEKCIRTSIYKSCEGRIDLAAGACVEDIDL